MARDNHAHFARIGFVVVAGFIAITATLVYLGGFKDRNSEFLVETYYDNPVTGLSVGSPVNLFGVKVGEVRKIDFAGVVYDDCDQGAAGLRRVCVVMALRKGLLGYDGNIDELRYDILSRYVEKGLRATIAMNGITGLARVDLNMVEDAQPPPKYGWTPRYPVVPSAPSLLESFSEAATKIVNRLKQTDFASVWSNVQSTAESMARLSGNAAATFESNQAGVAEIMRDVHQVTIEVRELSRTLNENPSLILRPRDSDPLPETEL